MYEDTDTEFNPPKSDKFRLNQHKVKDFVLIHLYLMSYPPSPAIKTPQNSKQPNKGNKI